jgi:hypothetical protein
MSASQRAMLTACSLQLIEASLHETDLEIQDPASLQVFYVAGGAPEMADNL